MKIKNTEYQTPRGGEISNFRIFLKAPLGMIFKIEYTKFEPDKINCFGIIMHLVLNNNQSLNMTEVTTIKITSSNLKDFGVKYLNFRAYFEPRFHFLSASLISRVQKRLSNIMTTGKFG